jgi:arylsulfatase A-like enzyme
MANAGWTRREFNRTAALAAAAAASPMGCGSSPEPEEGPTAKGIILITADDLGWRDIHSYGLTAIQTPGMDRLVAEGVAFDNAFDVVSTCSSSRATLATGQYPHTHGVTGLVHRHPELSLDPALPNMVRNLQTIGYHTAIQGKWHLSALEQPEAFGFTTYLATDIDQRIRTMEPALNFLEVQKANPHFYLELNFMQPHRDLFGDFTQAEGFEVSPDDAIPPEYWGLPDWTEIREEVAGYLSHVRWMDALIAELLDGLDALGMTEDTLVVFISDNGPAFPGCKTTVYDRGLGTPLMFRWPRALPPSRHDHLISSVDVAPTILGLANAPALAHAQGSNLRDLLTGAPDWAPFPFIYAEMEKHAGERPARSIRSVEYKYIRNLTEDAWGSGGGNGAWKDLLALEPDQTWDEPRPPEELFDMLADPLERNNLVDDPAYAEVLADLSHQLDLHMAETDDFRAEG